VINLTGELVPGGGGDDVWAEGSSAERDVDEEGQVVVSVLVLLHPVYQALLHVATTHNNRYI
jgi:hypothetical protein